MEKKNNRLAAMGCVTICISLLLMNVGRLDGILPDWAVRVIGAALMLCTAVMVFLTVRSLAVHGKEQAESKDENGKE